MTNSDSLGILKQLERGEISAAEAQARLDEPPTVERIDKPMIEDMTIPRWMKRLWLYPVTLGTFVVLLGTWIIMATVRANILWLVFGVPFVLLGALLISIGAGANSGHWLYINVQNSRKRKGNVRFAIPFPVGLVRLGLWIAQRFTPKSSMRINVGAENKNISAVFEDSGELMNAIERELREGRGISVDVDDKDEHVQVYIV